MSEWKWKITAYYGPGGRKGSKKRPYLGRVGEREGDLAIQTVHADDVSKDMELRVLENRSDIGSINVEQIGE